MVPCPLFSGNKLRLREDLPADYTVHAGEIYSKCSCEMSVSNQYLNVRPKADTSTVEDLVSLVHQGQVRIPSFQRDLKWESEDVLSLFDSIYKGYPIGSLLLRKGKAKASIVELGPLTIEAPETTSALWVVDGQQRLVSLTAGLAREGEMPETPDDPYVIYFDAKEKRFNAPPKTGGIPSTWVPVTKLLDATSLSEWIFNWSHSDDRNLRSSVFEAGKRIRQYRVPQYVITTDDEDLLRDIFHRVNKSGKRLEWSDVYDALYGDQRKEPSTLSDLSEAISEVGMGVPREEQLLSCVVASQGLDVTQNVGVHSQKPGVQKNLEHGVQDALPAIRRVLSFFRENAKIPHLRLLPRSTPLIILTRFFRLYPDPEPRTLTLLVRWTWRVLLEAFDRSEPTLKRRGVTSVVEDNESRAVQKLLDLVNTSPSSSYTLPDRFDARSSESRLALLGLHARAPQSLDTGEHLNVSSLIEQEDRRAFRRIWRRGSSSPANRILLPETGSARQELVDFIQASSDEAKRRRVLSSHCISERAEQALLNDNEEEFIGEREELIQKTVCELGTRLAEWDANDRPSIDTLLSSTANS